MWGGGDATSRLERQCVCVCGGGGDANLMFGAAVGVYGDTTFPLFH